MAYRDFTWANPAAGANIEWSDPFWLRSTVYPMVRWKVNECNQTGGIARTPPGYSAQALTAAGAGIAGANWLKYLTDQMALLGRTFTTYSLIPMQLGVAVEDDYTADPPNCPCLCQNWRDRVTIVSTASAATIAQIQVNTRFCANGISLTTTWASTMLDAFEAQRVIDGTAVPPYSHVDVEHDPADAFTVRDDGDGNWDPELADARASTELVDGVSTIAALRAAATDLNGDALTWNSTRNVERVQNHRFCEWISGIRQIVGEYAIDAAYLNKLLTLYPSCKTSNFDYSAATRANPYLGLRAWRSDWNRPMSHFYYQHLALYPLNNVSFGDPTYSTYAQQLARYGVTATGDLATDLDALNLARWKVMVQNALAASTKPLVISMAMPGFTRSLDNVQAGYTYTQSKAVTISIVRYIVTVNDPQDYYWWCDTDVTQQDWDDLGDVLDARGTAQAEYEALFDDELANILSSDATAIDRLSASARAVERVTGSARAVDRLVASANAVERTTGSARALDRIVVARPRGG